MRVYFDIVNHFFVSIFALVLIGVSRLFRTGVIEQAFSLGKFLSFYRNKSKLRYYSAIYYLDLKIHNTPKYRTLFVFVLFLTVMVTVLLALTIY